MTADRRAALVEKVTAILEANELDGHWPSVAASITNLIRAETLEEAARVCDAEADLCTEGCDRFTADCCATNIRALKGDSNGR